LLGELEMAVALDRQQAVALHPGHGLAHRRTALVEALGDAGAQRDDPLLLQLENGPQVHLGGVDQLAHAAIVPCHTHSRPTRRRTTGAATGTVRAWSPSPVSSTVRRTRATAAG